MRILLLLLLILMWGCSDTASSGGVTETGNAFVSGIVVDTQYNNVANREVFIAPANADPLSEDSLLFLVCTTDSEGTFKTPLISGGEYVLSSRNGTKGFIKEITVTAVTDSSTKENKIGEVPLLQTGSLLFTPTYFPESLPDAILISGTRFYAYKEDDNQYLLDSVPASLISSIEGKFETSNSSLETDIELKEKEFEVLSGRLNALFMVEGDTLTALTEAVKRERILLEELGFTTTTVDFNLVTPNSSALSSYDLIYGSSGLLWESNVSEWRTLPLPIATTATAGYKALAMTDTVDGSTGSREEITLLTDINGNHPAFYGTGWSSNFTVYPVENGSSVWGKPMVGTTCFLRGNASQVEKYLFAYRKDVEMYHSHIAPAGRIGLYFAESEVKDTQRTKNIIYRALLWGMHRL